MKIIVSHISPDIDSIASIWLIKRFLPNWSTAKIKFVSAGSTLNNTPVDNDPNIIHVDTGMGRFDHHQTTEYTSATQLVYQFLKKKNYIKEKHLLALERMVLLITDFDHFGEIFFPDPDNDRYEFMIHEIIEGGLKSILKDDLKIVKIIFPILDGIFNIFIKKNKAEEELKKGFIFQSKWGKSLVLESKNEETIKLGLKKNYQLVAKKNPEKGDIRIKITPKKKLSLKSLYEKIIKIDKKATWFLHISGSMLLNSSSKNPNFTPSKLTINQLIKLIKSV